MTIKKTTHYSLAKDKIRILLLEGIHENAINFFKENEYTNIEYVKNAIDKEQLIKKIKNVHMIGIRSRTHLTKEVLEHAKLLIAVGCFSIGTNQVDLTTAKMKGIPVFNAPFSNTRSVAELVISEAIQLMRRIPERNSAAHEGRWLKDAKASFEVRGKTIGIIGYGHIGSQVSVLAESMGLNVLYYDIEKKLTLGNAKACDNLAELLSNSDVVTLHVPDTPLTRNMMTIKELALMKKGAYLINASRGSVVDIDALAGFLESGDIAGAAIDVYPKEPGSNKEPFVSSLQKFPNVILTPHIGGSTVEAQSSIALEVSEKLVKYSDVGATIGATNFVEISLTPNYNKQRYLHIHQNKPGMLNKISKVFVSRKLNIASQFLQTDPDIGYVIIDIDSKADSNEILNELKSIRGTIKARVLF